LTNENLSDSVSSSDSHNDLDSDIIVESTITGNDEVFALVALLRQRSKDGLNKILQVVLLLENSNLFTETTGSRLLILERSCLDVLNSKLLGFYHKIVR